MQIFIDQLITGLTLGSLYALVALGLTLTFGVVRLINFAHGEFFMLAAYVLWFLVQQFQIPYLPSAALTALALGLIGVLFERVIVHPILERPWYIHAVATLAVSTALVSGMNILMGTTPRAAPTPYTRTLVPLLGFNISLQRILIVVVTLISFALLNAFVKRTKLGKAMQAMSQNREVCKVVGIDARQVALVAFAIGAALAGLAAAFIIPVFVITPDIGANITLRAFATIIVAGMGKVQETLYGAFLLGVTEAFVAGYITSAYAPVAPFLMMIFVLLFRPEGIFGRKVGL